MIGFPIALFVANGFEWYAHNKLLHGTLQGPGKPRYSPMPVAMKSHWIHHKMVRTQGYRDEGYDEGLANWRTRGELGNVLKATAITSLAFPVAPFFVLGTYYAAANYFYTHARSHLDPEWGRKAIPWHYDHHMNTNQDANWCVTKPWFDYIMGTRVIADPAHAETNPLGIRLPKFVEKRVNALARRLLPHAFERLDANRERERQNRKDGVDLPIPEYGDKAAA
jgi:hypothetical protein